ncbi:LOW QUALITY PROTEIN: Kinesin light chain [Paramyrothecium foliicola]|nr:LOW QUALITY PROTEIN: Kinesin light chain [Paramyrothecium foliicola]
MNEYHGLVDGHNIVSAAVGAGGVINNNFHTPSITYRAPKSIPLPKNEGIVSRPDLVAQIHELLPVNGGGQSAALYGLGGSGKTQLALEYAYRRSEEQSCAVFWVHAEDQVTFTRDYMKIAKLLDLKVDNLAPGDLLSAVRDGIQQQSNWLLVLDNADNLELFGVGSRIGETTEAISTLSIGGKAASQRTMLSLSPQPRSQTVQARHLKPAARTSASVQTRINNAAPKIPKRLEHYVPTGPQGTVLWTTRDEDIVVNLVDAQRGIQVARMREVEARQLLTRTRRQRTGCEDAIEDVDALLLELQWLPLAIYQAASYMRETETSVHDYLAMLLGKEQRWAVLSETHYDRHRPRAASNCILATWDISIQHIRDIDPLAHKILHIVAFFENQNIPFDLIKAAAMYTHATNAEKKQIQYSAAKVGRATRRLMNFSFLTKQTDDLRYEMHKLVQEGVRYRLSGIAVESAVRFGDSRTALSPSKEPKSMTRIRPMKPRGGQSQRLPSGRPSLQSSKPSVAGEQWPSHGQYFANAALSIISDFFPEKTEYGTWEECEKYLPHAMQITKHVDLCQQNLQVGLLLQRISNYLFERQRWREKELVDLKALRLLQDEFGDTDLHVLTSLSNLATTYWGLNQYEEAGKIEDMLLDRNIALFGEIDPRTLSSMHDLACTYFRQARYDAAEILVTHAYLTQKQILGQRAVDTLQTQSLLALVLREQGRFEEAEAHFDELLQVTPQVFGESHPNTLKVQNNHVVAHLKQGRFGDAEKTLVHILEHLQDCQDEEITFSLTVQSNLAQAYRGQGRYHEAETLGSQVLEQEHKILGEDHPRTMDAKLELALTYKAQGKNQAAIALLEDNVALCIKNLGADDPQAKHFEDLLTEWKRLLEQPKEPPL